MFTAICYMWQPDSYRGRHTGSTDAGTLRSRQRGEEGDHQPSWSCEKGSGANLEPESQAHTSATDLWML